MNETQKKKTKFRNSKKWKEFRHIKWVEQDGRCAICNSKLTKTANLHHLDLNPEHYEDLSNRENFMFLCHSCHEMAHYKFKQFLKYPYLIDNFRVCLLRMMELSCR